MKYPIGNTLFMGLCSLIVAFILTTNALAQDSLSENRGINIQNLFTSSGWVGDGEFGRKYITFEGANEINPHSNPSCIKIKYEFGPKKWAGIYWQNQPDNWGDLPGNNYSKEGLTQVTFWAKGTSGKEVLEFKSGGIRHSSKTHHDTYVSTTGRITLATNWKQYTINLKNADLSSVIGGFCWVASKDYNNSDSITFYLDDIQFQ